MGKNSRESFKDGGKLPFMKDTSWNRLIQRIVTDEGVQKGMITVIAETGEYIFQSLSLVMNSKSSIVVIKIFFHMLEICF